MNWSYWSMQFAAVGFGPLTGLMFGYLMKKGRRNGFNDH